jgi:uncharacterized membrane protein YphA (DoxX/SURF4 family)
MIPFMLNPFPTLLTFRLLGPMLIRIALGIYFISFGLKRFKKEDSTLVEFFESLSLKPASNYLKGLATLEVFIGACLIIGISTQIMAIISAIISFVMFVVAIRSENSSLEKPSFYALLFVLGISLIFTGAGFALVDLPL